MTNEQKTQSPSTDKYGPNSPLYKFGYLIGMTFHDETSADTRASHQDFLRKRAKNLAFMQKEIEAWGSEDSRRMAGHRRQTKEMLKITQNSPRCSFITNILRRTWPDIQAIYHADFKVKVPDFKALIPLLKATIQHVNEHDFSGKRREVLTGLYILRHALKEISRLEYHESRKARAKRKWNVYQYSGAQPQILSMIGLYGLISGKKDFYRFLSALLKAIGAITYRERLNIPKAHSEVAAWLPKELKGILDAKPELIKQAIHVLSAYQKILKRTRSHWTCLKPEFAGMMCQYDENRILLHILHGYQNTK